MRQLHCLASICSTAAKSVSQTAFESMVALVNQPLQMLGNAGRADVKPLWVEGSFASGWSTSEPSPAYLDHTCPAAGLLVIGIDQRNLPRSMRPRFQPTTRG